MTPRIQRDESLHSYMQRALYINLGYLNLSKFKKLLPYRVDKITIKSIASVLDWPGCYGFNRLLHEHTNFAITGVFKNPCDISYSQKDYITKSGSPVLDKTQYSYCPECVREDLSSFGFSYWRRTHQLDVSVCGYHNLILVTSCPFCDKTFASGNNVEKTWFNHQNKFFCEAEELFKGHFLDVMWQGCSGKKLSDITAIKNENYEAFKKAKFFNDILAYKFHIDTESAAHVLYERYCFLKSTNIQFSSQCLENLDCIKSFIKELHEARSENGRKFSDIREALINFALSIYGSFKDFAADVELRDAHPYPIESLWSCYASEGYNSVHYIEENYNTGVGLWSIPYPSSEKLSPYSRDGSRARTPIIYPCCNFENPVKVGDRLAPRKVRASMPKIPLL